MAEPPVSDGLDGTASWEPEDDGLDCDEEPREPEEGCEDVPLGDVDVGSLAEAERDDGPETYEEVGGS